MDMTNICNIKVVGVGGGGNKAVNRMISAGVGGVYFVAVNTDKQDLMMSNADEIIQIGKQITKGLGAGSNSDVGKAAAEESEQEIKKMLEGTDLVFITAGLGGGTGNGAAPVIAKYAHEMGILTVGVVTKPFRFEGAKRASNAESGMAELEKYVDSLVIIPNDKLYTIFKKDVSFVDAFRYADDVLRQAIQGVSDVISKPGSINLDFADVATIMRNKGLAHMGIGKGRGANKTIEAVRQAVTSQLLETSIEGATGILINIAGGDDLTVSEVYEAADLVRDVADPKCNVIFGANFNNNTPGEATVTIIATGFDKKDNVEETVPEFKDHSADFRAFTEPQPVAEETIDPEPAADTEDKVEDISIASKKPIVDDEDIPPFLRKLRK
ncbi:MAG: cell division protein FtsZ [Clostridiales bacterium]|nr:cell division protein FtsZ [Clostridiales bacterium]